jgi:hypothetical protein
MAAKVTSAGEFAENLLKLIFNATAYANLADNAVTLPFSNLYVSLHTSSPGASGAQNTNETSYTSYTRIAVARTSSGWTVSGGTVYPVSNVQFPQCTGGSATITHFGVGTSSGTSAGHLLYFGSVSPNISVSNGITPILVGGVSETVITES